MNQDYISITVTIEGEGTKKVIKAQRGESLLQVLRQNGYHVIAPCGGQGTCGKCSVSIAGSGKVQSCQYDVTKDIEVLLPAKNRALILNDIGRDLKKVKHDSGLALSPANHISCKMDDIEQPIDLHPKDTGLFGLAIDIGTTTVVVYLEDLLTYSTVDVATFINPQTLYGHDVVSRIQYSREQKNGLSELRTSLIEAINLSIIKLCHRNQIENQHIYKVTVVGNTTMLHLFLDVDPSSIAFAPYTPQFIEEKIISGVESGLTMHEKGFVRILPSVSAYIGADITAGIASTDVADNGDYTLFVDIGTNGEMALGKQGHLYCCSTAAGPAFEGANISCGIGGVEGAISEYKNGIYKTIGDKPPKGICGSGLLDIVAELRDKGIIDATGYMEKDYLIEKKKNTSIDRDIVLTPQDVREVQLAVAAIYAGIKILAKSSGLDIHEIERVYLAGGFGNYLNIDSAIRIGLLPASLQEKVIQVGNSAGKGALLALRSNDFAASVNKIANMAEYIELSMRMDFNELYVESMNLGQRD